MEYGYQKVLEVQRRCGVSFEDADKALKTEKGDVDKACVLAMRKKGQSEKLNKEIGRLKNFITYRMKISRDGEIKFDISLGIIMLVSILVVIFSFWRDGFAVLSLLYFIIFAITVFTGYSLEFVPDEKRQETKLETVQEKEKTEEQVFEENTENEVAPDDEGFNLIEIE